MTLLHPRAGLLRGLRLSPLSEELQEAQAQLSALIKQPGVLSARGRMLTLGLGLDLIGVIAFHLSAFLRHFN